MRKSLLIDVCKSARYPVFLALQWGHPIFPSVPHGASSQYRTCSRQHCVFLMEFLLFNCFHSSSRNFRIFFFVSFVFSSFILIRMFLSISGSLHLSGVTNCAAAGRVRRGHGGITADVLWVHWNFNCQTDFMRFVVVFVVLILITSMILIVW